MGDKVESNELPGKPQDREAEGMPTQNLEKRTFPIKI